MDSYDVPLSAQDQQATMESFDLRQSAEQQQSPMENYGNPFSPEAMACYAAGWKDADGAITCLHNVKVLGIEVTHYNKDFFPSLPEYCIDCHTDQLALSQPEPVMETRPDVPASVDDDAWFLPDPTQPQPQDAPNEHFGQGVDNDAWYLPNSPRQQAFPDEQLLTRMNDLNVAEHQLHIAPESKPDIPSWTEETLEQRLQNLSAQEKGFTRADSRAPRSGYCAHGFCVRREVEADRFSCYDPPRYVPLAEECERCCFSFLQKEMHEIRLGFLKRKEMAERGMQEGVGPTMHRVCLQWQWIWAVMWKANKWKEEWRFERTKEGEEMFEEELRHASQGGTMELPIPFKTGYGRWPGVIMHGD